jgi:TetR/AcrR family tetracycline transcriptional repressor
MKLTRDKVIADARSLVNEEGLDALTTRRLGDRLGVKGPALYRHFKNKQEIIDALARTFFKGPAEPTADDTWQGWLEGRALSTRRELLSCRDGARIVAMARPNLVEGGHLDRLLLPLTKVGFDTREAILASHLIGRLVIGWTMSEQEHDGQIPPASANIDPDAGFEFAVKCVIAGLEMRLIAKKMAGGNA